MVARKLGLKDHEWEIDFISDRLREDWHKKDRKDPVDFK